MASQFCTSPFGSWVLTNSVWAFSLIPWYVTPDNIVVGYHVLYSEYPRRECYMDYGIRYLKEWRVPLAEIVRMGSFNSADQQYIVKIFERCEPDLPQTSQRIAGIPKSMRCGLIFLPDNQLNLEKVIIVWESELTGKSPYAMALVLHLRRSMTVDLTDVKKFTKLLETALNNIRSATTTDEGEDGEDHLTSLPITSAKYYYFTILMGRDELGEYILNMRSRFLHIGCS
jgi:hypothetical protein